MPAVAEKRDHVRKRWAVDVPFTKQASSAPEADTGDLELLGYANTWVQDRDGDWMDQSAFDSSLDDYLAKNPILLYQHNMRQPLGVVNEAYTDDTGLFVRCTVPKPDATQPDWKHDAYHSMAQGVLRTFSIGGFFTFDVENLGEDDEKWIIREVELLEVSVVSVPSNPDSVFQAAKKALEGETPRGDMSEAQFSEFCQLLGVEELTDDVLKALEPQQREVRYRNLSAIFARAMGRAAPDYEAYRALLARTEGRPVVEQLAAVPELSALHATLYAPAGKSIRACPNCGHQVED